MEQLPVKPGLLEKRQVNLTRTIYIVLQKHVWNKMDRKGNKWTCPGNDEGKIDIYEKRRIGEALDESSRLLTLSTKDTVKSKNWWQQRLSYNKTEVPLTDY